MMFDWNTSEMTITILKTIENIKNLEKEKEMQTDKQKPKGIIDNLLQKKIINIFFRPQKGSLKESLRDTVQAKFVSYVGLDIVYLKGFLAGEYDRLTNTQETLSHKDFIISHYVYDERCKQDLYSVTCKGKCFGFIFEDERSLEELRVLGEEKEKVMQEKCECKECCKENCNEDNESNENEKELTQFQIERRLEDLRSNSIFFPIINHTAILIIDEINRLENELEELRCKSTKEKIQAIKLNIKNLKMDRKILEDNSHWNNWIHVTRLLDIEIKELEEELADAK